ncbi:MAG TPA: MotA/TolQ/ExbB proton channel family protein, partial [Opitutaceae bacterium]|nr:MotA/TolQ/ExbB proton channel family protein [Opitutaceae bacterium]
GTILGMITTFQTFTANGNYVLASILADGMWQALISTAASLMIAIPIQFAHHFLTGRVRALVRDIEWSANEIMRYLLQEYRNEGPAAEEVVTK